MKKALKLLILFVFLISAGCLLIVLNVNSILNSSFVKTKILEKVETKHHLRLSFKRINVNLFSFRYTLRGLRVTKKHESIYVPLIKGSLDLSWFLKTKNPFKTAYVFFPKVKVVVNEKEKSLTWEKFLKELTELTRFSLKFLKVYKGEVQYDFFSGNQFLNKVIVRDISLILQKNESQLIAEGESSKLSFAKFLKFKLRVNKRDSLFGEASLYFKDLDIGKFLRVSWIKKHLSKFNTRLNGSLEATLEESKIYLGISLVHSTLELRRKKSLLEKEVVLDYLQGTGFVSKNRSVFKITGLRLDYPYFKGAAKLVNLKKLSFKVFALSFEDLREFLSYLFPKSRGVRKFLEVMKNGKFFGLKGSISKTNPFKLSISLKGNVKSGEVFLKYLPLMIKKIEGSFSYANKVLSFKGRGNVGNKISLRAEKLRLVFGHPFKVNFLVEFKGRAKEIKKVLEDFRFLNERQRRLLSVVKLIGKIKGQIGLSIRISPFSLKGSIKIQGKELFVTSQKAKINASIDEAAFFTDFKNFYFEAKGIRGKGFFANYMRIVYNSPRKGLKIYAKKLRFNPQVLQLLIGIKRIKNLIIKYRPNFNSLILNEIKFSWKVNEKNLSLLELLKTLSLSGSVKGGSIIVPFKRGKVPLRIPYLSFNLNHLRLTGRFSGALDKELVKGLGELKYLKYLNFPFNIDNGTFEWQIPRRLNLRFSLKKGDLSIFTDFKTDFNEFLANLKLLGKVSKFLVKSSYSKKKLNLALNGTLDLTEFSRAFLKKGLKLVGKIESNSNLELPVVNSWDGFVKGFWARGSFNAKFYFGKNNFYLKGTLAKKKICIKKFKVFYRGSSLRGKGSIEISPVTYVNLVASARELNFKEVFSYDKKETHSASQIKVKKVPVLVHFLIRAKRVIWITSHQLDEVAGEGVFNGKEGCLLFRLSSANFGGIKLKGFSYVSLKTGEKWIFLDIPDSKGDFKNLVKHIYPEETPKVYIDGKFWIRGYLYALLKGEGKVVNSCGRIYLDSKRGYIYRAPLLASILGVLSPIDIFKGKLPNLKKGKLPYDKLELRAYLKGDTVYIAPVYLSASGFRLFGKGKLFLPSKNINLVVYVSPFKTIDVILEKVPVLGKLLLSRSNMLLYFPLQVKGKIGHYKIKVLTLKSLEKGIVDFISKIFGGKKEFKKLKNSVESNKAWWLRKRNEFLREMASCTLRRQVLNCSK